MIIETEFESNEEIADNVRAEKAYFKRLRKEALG